MEQVYALYGAFSKYRVPRDMRTMVLRHVTAVAIKRCRRYNLLCPVSHQCLICTLAERRFAYVAAVIAVLRRNFSLEY